MADVGGYIASLLATSGNARFNVVYSIKMHQNIAFNSCMKCGVYTIQNMMTHTFRGCTHHTPCFIYYAFISLFKNPSNKLYPVNRILIVQMPNGLLQMHACHSCASSNITTHTFMRDCTHHTLYCISTWFYSIAIFKNSLMCPKSKFCWLKNKQAKASGVLQQIDSLYFWRVAPITPPASIIHTFYISLF